MTENEKPGRGLERTDEVQVVPYSPEYAADFQALNRQWIEQYFRVEEPDSAVFADPYGAIVAPGGEIFFVVSNGRALGTCAVIRQTESVFELAKMAVSPEAQGRGYGDLLMQAAVDFSRRAGCQTLMLLSNTILEPALRLYAKHGFHHLPVEDKHGYSRANVHMELSLREDDDDKSGALDQ